MNEFGHSEALLAEAKALHDKYVTMDGHNDLPWSLHEAYGHALSTVNLREPQGGVYKKELRHAYLHTDVPRMRAGGLTAQFWSVYVPTTVQGDAAVQATLGQIDCVRRLCAEYPDVFEYASTAADVRRIFKAGRVASMMGVEGGHQINASLATLRMYYALGVRYMTLTHNGGPGWADAALDANSKFNEHATCGGLSRFGECVVGEMNRLGMAVDLAHVHVDTMRKAMSVSKAPCIFSHSNTRAVCNHPRNVPDDILLDLVARDGVLMLNFNSPFVAGDFFVDKQGSVGASVIEVADHVDHAKKVCGTVAHLGLGADFDGIKAPARGLGDVSTYPVLTAELLKRKYTELEIAGILGENVLRVMEKIEKVAFGLRGEPASDAKPGDFGETY